jgi:hypothetical protein
LLDVSDEVRAVLEPGTNVAGTIAKHDDSGADPFLYEPDHIYAWPGRSVFVVEGDGSLDLERFTVHVAYVADSGTEQAAQLRSRDVSEVVDAKAKAYAAAIRANRTRTGIWEHIQVDAVDWDRLRALEVRGFVMDLSGYRLI